MADGLYSMAAAGSETCSWWPMLMVSRFSQGAVHLYANPALGKSPQPGPQRLLLLVLSVVSTPVLSRWVVPLVDW